MGVMDAMDRGAPRAQGRTGRRAVLAGVAALAGCQQPAPAAPVVSTPHLGPNGIGYLGIQVALTPQTSALFVRNVNQLLALNASEIYVLISSPGGSVTAAEAIIRFIDETRAARGVRFTTHNVGLVASAAAYVFLAGGRRVSVPGGAFLFHEASLVADGALTSQALQEANQSMQRIERSFTSMLTSRTRVTEAEASSFIRRTVILNAPEAQRDGVIQDIAPFTLPTGATITVISSTPPRSATTPPRAPDLPR